MQSFDKKRFYSYRADANALGGFLDEPFQKIIPTLAPVSLPAAGGFATARSEAFRLDETVSCASAYTQVTGRKSPKDDSHSILVTAVVEGLNILEVVTAERIVAQISVTIPHEEGPWKVSFAGTHFEGLRLAGRPSVPKLNSDLHRPEGERRGQAAPLTWQDMQRAGREQAKKLISCFKERGGEDAYQWAVHRHGWMTSDAQPGAGRALCSLVDGFEDSGPNTCYGHIVEIPGFGRIFLGELLIFPDSVQLVSIRAELGCPLKGVVTGPTPAASGGGGGPDS